MGQLAVGKLVKQIRAPFVVSPLTVGLNEGLMSFMRAKKRNDRQKHNKQRTARTESKTKNQMSESKIKAREWTAES